MKKCSVRPYNGEQKYIYISYSFKDKRYVYPIIEQLSKDGYRVWYDEGVAYGSEMMGEIASKIIGCDLFLAFVSDNTADSYHFKREFNFAVLKSKNIVAVMLKEVQLSLGMELQLSAFPAIYKYKLEAGDFYKRLYSYDSLECCLGEPNDNVVVSDENEYAETLIDLYGSDDRVRPSLDDSLFFKKEEEGKVPKAVLTKLTTNEKIVITSPKMVIGRGVSEKNKPVVDYSIETNSMISRIHAVVLYKNNEFYVVDCGSVNSTYINGEALTVNEERVLRDGDVVKFANENYRFERIEV